MSAAKCTFTTDQSCDDNPAPTTSSSTGPATPNSPQTQSPPDVPIQNQKSKIQNKPHQNRYKSETSRAADDFDRRLHHYEKLAQLREAQQRGLPSMVQLDPNDGPIPRIEYQLDDPGYQPTVQTKDQQAQLVRDYMQKLHEQNNPNRQRVTTNSPLTYSPLTSPQSNCQSTPHPR